MSASTGAATGMAGLMGGPWGALISGGLGLFGSLFGGHEQSDAARYATDAQIRAAQLASNDQTQANFAATQFAKQQAKNAFLNSEVARRGNYDQWAAREKRLGSIADRLGWGSRDIPAYAPGVDPQFAGPQPVGAYLGTPAMATPAALTPALRMPDPYRVGPVGAYL